MNCLGNNGRDLMKEGVVDGAFAYAVSQVMKPGDRSDPRHSDGGISLLHMGLSIAGEMAVQCWFKQGHASKTLQQRPGSIYISNMCTVEHQVADASCFLVKLLTRPGVGRDSFESVRKTFQPIVEFDSLEGPNALKAIAPIRYLELSWEPC